LGEDLAELFGALLQSHRTQPNGPAWLNCGESKNLLDHLGVKERIEEGETGRIARIAGTVILSAIVFVVVSLLVSVGVYWATDGVFKGALIGVICGTAAAFAVGAVGIAVGRRSSDEGSRSGRDR